MTAPVEELWERIESRAAEHPPITRDQIEQWQEQFETPTEEELALYDRPLIKDLS